MQNLLIPFLIRTTLKLIKNPIWLPVILRWLKIWACHRGFICSTALSSQMIMFSTKTSNLRLSLNMSPSYLMVTSVCLLWKIPFLLSSWQKHISYIFSRNPGPIENELWRLHQLYLCTNMIHVLRDCTLLFLNFILGW